jgi:hypothetical protein
VAAPVRSAAPVRRHQSLMSDLDRPDAAGDPLRCENVLFAIKHPFTKTLYVICEIAGPTPTAELS